MTRTWRDCTTTALSSSSGIHSGTLGGCKCQCLLFFLCMWAAVYYKQSLWAYHSMFVPNMSAPRRRTLSSTSSSSSYHSWACVLLLTVTVHSVSCAVKGCGSGLGRLLAKYILFKQLIALIVTQCKSLCRTKTQCITTAHHSHTHVDTQMCAQPMLTGMVYLGLWKGLSVWSVWIFHLVPFLYF